ncbi:MAG: 23S rRNA (guanosine(2251)-2'-O)-methyltransferase RlmB [Chloroflexi bacterium]|nr:23S rRNA (guanosine(2251)-2'-O)-methyltransferase RlmB [Chloroflexota bacterium]
MEGEDLVWGRNAVLETLRAGRPLRRLYVAQGLPPNANIAEALAEARSAGVPVQRVPREALDRLTGNGHHQGIAAAVAAHEYSSLDDILAVAGERGEEALILVLDSLQDPQNFGSLLRTAEAVGAHGVIIPKHRAVGITAAVAKVSAGAVEHLKVAQVTNLPRALEGLKERGIWAVGVDMAGQRAYDEQDLRLPLALVVGNEGKGLGRLVREKCDLTVRLPMRGHVASLNAAVAGAIVLYEAWRQRTRAAPR